MNDEHSSYIVASVPKNECLSNSDECIEENVDVPLAEVDSSTPYSAKLTELSMQNIMPQEYKPPIKATERIPLSKELKTKDIVSDPSVSTKDSPKIKGCFLSADEKNFHDKEKCINVQSEGVNDGDNFPAAENELEEFKTKNEPPPDQQSKLKRMDSTLAMKEIKSTCLEEQSEESIRVAERVKEGSTSQAVTKRPSTEISVVSLNTTSDTTVPLFLLSGVDETKNAETFKVSGEHQ